MKHIILVAMLAFSIVSYAEHELKDNKKFNCDSIRDYDSELAHHLVEKKDALLLDVRTLIEYKISKIDGSKRIHVSDIEDEISTIKRWVNNDLTKPVVVYCAAGVRAARAKKILEKHGFKCVQNLGGISEW